MKSKIVVLSFGIVVTAFFLSFQSCRKINLSTQLGQDLIPPVDNITTFDTTLSVEAYNDLFTLLNDTLRLFSNEEHYLGKITNDPLFGETDARLFLELKPGAFPHKFARADSLTIDSIVLVLGYNSTFGDTAQPQTVTAYKIDNTVDFRSDSSYNIRSNNFTYSTLLGFKIFKPQNLKDSVFAFRDTTNNQLRIRLQNNFGQTLLDYDSLVYKSDSVFRTLLKGFALQSTSGGNAVMGFDLNSVNTKLAIYYNYPKPGGAGRDTTVNYFRFTTTSANANYVIRNYSGSQLATYQGGASPDNLVFLQNTPGSYAKIKIPGLANLNNRIIHRAELIVEQVYNPTNATFPSPDFMYLDAYDTTLKKYRTIPYDLTLGISGQLNRASFGMIPKNTVDVSGNPIKVWKFNISRYLQHVVNQTSPVYDLRLTTPFSIMNQYQPAGSTSPANLVVFVNTSILRGRVLVGGGNHATQKMRLRIIYTKI